MAIGLGDVLAAQRRYGNPGGGGILSRMGGMMPQGSNEQATYNDIMRRTGQNGLQTNTPPPGAFGLRQPSGGFGGAMQMPNVSAMAGMGMSGPGGSMGGGGGQRLSWAGGTGNTWGPGGPANVTGGLGGGSSGAGLAGTSMMGSRGMGAPGGGGPSGGPGRYNVGSGYQPGTSSGFSATMSASPRGARQFTQGAPSQTASQASPYANITGLGGQSIPAPSAGPPSGSASPMPIPSPSSFGTSGTMGTYPGGLTAGTSGTGLGGGGPSGISTPPPGGGAASSSGYNPFSGGAWGYNPSNGMGLNSQFNQNANGPGMMNYGGGYNNPMQANAGAAQSLQFGMAPNGVAPGGGSTTPGMPSQGSFSSVPFRNGPGGYSMGMGVRV